MNIRAIKLVTGEDVFGAVDYDGEDIVVENAVKLIMVPGQSSHSQPSFGFAPYPMYATGSTNLKLTISKKHVIFDVEPDQDFINQYNSIFGTGIVTPSKNIII